MTKTQKKKAIQMYMLEDGMNRKDAEQRVDNMEYALASWENPMQWVQAEKNWNERNPKLRDNERV